MSKKNFKELNGWEGEVYLWLEQDSSIMVKAVSKFGDPVELTSTEAREFVNFLNETADLLDKNN